MNILFYPEGYGEPLNGGDMSKCAFRVQHYDRNIEYGTKVCDEQKKN